MQYDDDIAFQRAILANPADTTLKLVYADWLQDRADPRAEYIRLLIKLDLWKEGEAWSLSWAHSYWQRTESLRELGATLNPTWVTFMNTFAQPFAPGGFTFGEQVGTRGAIWHFASQYQDPNAWSGALIADVVFLAGTFGPDFYSEAGGLAGGGFLCDLPENTEPFTANTILAALKLSEEYYSDGYEVPERCWVHQIYEAQSMMYHEEGEMVGEHGKLKRYVANEELWYLNLVVEELQDTDGEYLAAVLTLGRSPHGNRLIGAIGFPIKRRWR